jgi:general nucleoside transport system permease protein
VGFFAALWIGTNFEAMSRPLHVLLAILASIVAGAIWGGIAGILKATVGAHEVITTIMLNWIAIFGGSYLVEIGGPLQGAQPSIPRSDDVYPSAELWPIWGSLPSLHAGIFIALFALFVYYLLLNRTTLGYEVRAVGFNPEAARYGGISVARNYFLALAISGAFAGLAGSVDLLGFKGGVSTGDFPTNLIAFTGIAVALLGRNKAIGILFAALLFAALEVGTSTRQLDPEVFEPALAVDLATMIQALVIFFVGAELLIVYLWQARRFLTPHPRVRPEPER